MSKISPPDLKIISLILSFIFLGLIIKLNSDPQLSQLINPFVASRSKLATLPSTALLPSPTPTLIPTPKPLTISQMNSLYGPCTYTPTLMYHHIQTQTAAIADHQASLTVYTDFFDRQMQYLADHGYTAITPLQLMNFFDQGTALPQKSVLLTFDDGYSDFYTDAAPILKKHNFSAIMFLPTGLMNNPDYLTWNQIGQLSNITFANHTWSHKAVTAGTEIISKEILTADTQLSDHKLNSPKTFAYPYGTTSAFTTAFLSQHNYSLAFTTKPGNILCAKQRLTLPRVRIGNTPLSYYGL